MDVCPLACPELLYLATSAGYEAQNKKKLQSSKSKALQRITRHRARPEGQAEDYPDHHHDSARDQ